MPNDRRLIEDFLPIQTMGTEASREVRIEEIAERVATDAMRSAVSR